MNYLVDPGKRLQSTYLLGKTVTSDYDTNFLEVGRLKRTNSSTIISKLKRHFARQGIPEQVNSDNAQNLTSDEFQRFARDWDFEHVTVSPYNSKANGKAESSVKAAKRMLRKMKKSGTDPYYRPAGDSQHPNTRNRQ
ncbi:PREDICTED: endogenous retrovirus group K member 18 Pol protein-like [Priapulus caudatus]|uniref:Endogenous retrovirus group K member 18 Pol protein-like n=1 Tax=Priapulus caudatus TaxID=37621 RepID=A0ABM1ER43_PRICU|nr:PREDICTED: endogenous retrovirus group K member 18 Pol protein-like [Priapulus caudatus]